MPGRSFEKDKVTLPSRDTIAWMNDGTAKHRGSSIVNGMALLARVTMRCRSMCMVVRARRACARGKDPSSLAIPSFMYAVVSRVSHFVFPIIEILVDC
jgi:hypothetical protein